MGSTLPKSEANPIQKAKSALSLGLKPPIAQKPLFDPIIITIPKNSIKKPTDGAAETTDKTSTALQDSRTTESIPPSSETDSTNGGRRGTPGDLRPRLVEGKEISPAKIIACSIYVSQDSISILKGGGSLGILVGFEEGGNLRSIAASSTSPDDVQIKLAPEIAGLSGRSFYVIKSVSPKTGVFQVVLEAPCGRKEITVKVR
jgi:hypothetical protein